MGMKEMHSQMTTGLDEESENINTNISKSVGCSINKHNYK